LVTKYFGEIKMISFIIKRDPFDLIGLTPQKRKILFENDKYIFLQVGGSSYWSGMCGMRYSSPNFEKIIKK
jgi:hypothetical protein